MRLLLAFPAWLMVFYALEVLPVGLVQTIQNLIPLINILLAYLFLDETMRAIEVINILVSFSVVIIMIFYSSRAPNLESLPSNSGFMLALLLCCLSSFFLSVVNIILRYLKSVHYLILSGF
jgi:drug/metabolite transporter (DMT)-like permease